jgi:hypothetical protein
MCWTSTSESALIDTVEFNYPGPSTSFLEVSWLNGVQYIQTESPSGKSPPLEQHKSAELDMADSQYRPVDPPPGQFGLESVSTRNTTEVCFSPSLPLLIVEGRRPTRRE